MEKWQLILTLGFLLYGSLFVYLVIIDFSPKNWVEWLFLILYPVIGVFLFGKGFYPGYYEVFKAGRRLASKKDFTFPSWYKKVWIVGFVLFCLVYFVALLKIIIK